MCLLKYMHCIMISRVSKSYHDTSCIKIIPRYHHVMHQKRIIIYDLLKMYRDISKIYHDTSYIQKGIMISLIVLSM